MKEKEQAITIFSKNNITIKKCHLRNASEAGLYIPRLSRVYCCDSPVVEYVTTSLTTNYNSQPVYKKNKNDYEIVKCESPLGFYYNKKIYTYNKPTFVSPVEDYRKDIVTIIIYGGDSDYVYNISYLTAYHGTTINIETRPWDLVGGAFPDNYIFGLLDDINKIFDVVEACKHNVGYKYSSDTYDEKNIYPKSVHEIRRDVIEDLFGDPDGPKFQTNDEKILAHGFDIKTSFRKM